MMKTKSIKSATLITNAVTYRRVSSKEQDDSGFSLAAQDRLLREYSDRYGFPVVAEFMDVETAKQAGRSAFSEMIEFIKKNKATCRTILVEKTDRLYRNIKDWVVIDELDVDIHLVKEGSVISRESGSNAKFLHGIKVLMAKNYVDNLSEEARKGMLEKAEQGLWPSAAPFGYLNVVGPDGKKTIAPDPERAQIIRRIFENYASGDMSVEEVTKIARDEGLTFRHSKKALPISSVHRLLGIETYSGTFMWKGRRFTGKYEPLITRELFDKVQAVKTKRNNRKTRKAVHDFTFARMVTCGHCGCAVVGDVKKGKYVYYRCSGAKGECGERYVREEVLSEHFESILTRMRFDEEMHAWVRMALKESHEAEQRTSDEAVASLTSEMSRLQKRIHAAYDDKVDGRIDAAFYDEKVNQWRAEQARIREAIARHEHADREYLDSGVRLLELAQQAGQLFRTQPGAEKRKLLDFVLSNCTWANGELRVTFREPFDLIADSAVATKEMRPAGSVSSEPHPTWLGN